MSRGTRGGGLELDVEGQALRSIDGCLGLRNLKTGGTDGAVVEPH